MNILFYIIASNVLSLGASLLFGYEFHEAAAIIGLNLAAAAFFISIITANDLIKLLELLRESAKNKDEQ